MNVGTMTLVGSNSATGGSATNVSNGTYTNVNILSGNIGGIIISNNYAGVQPVFNLLEWGGDPTDTHDSAAALNGCLTANATTSGLGGYPVYIPNGEYMIKSDINIPTNTLSGGNINLTMFGDGEANSRLDFQLSASSTNIACLNLYYQGFSYFHDFYIDNSSSGGLSEHELLFDNNCRLQLSRVEFEGFDTCSNLIVLGGPTGGSQFQGYPSAIYDCYLDGGSNANLVCQQAVNGLTVEGCDFHGTMGTHIFLNDPSTGKDQYCHIFADIFEGTNPNTNSIYINNAWSTFIGFCGFDDNGTSNQCNIYYGAKGVLGTEIGNFFSAPASWTDNSTVGVVNGNQYCGNTHWNTSYGGVGGGIFLGPYDQFSGSNAVVNGQYSMKTNGPPPAPIAGQGFLWTSNNVLYFVTAVKTNYVCGP